MLAELKIIDVWTVEVGNLLREVLSGGLIKDSGKLVQRDHTVLNMLAVHTMSILSILLSIQGAIYEEIKGSQDWAGRQPSWLTCLLITLRRHHYQSTIRVVCQKRTLCLPSRFFHSLEQPTYLSLSYKNVIPMLESSEDVFIGIGDSVWKPKSSDRLDLKKLRLGNYIFIKTSKEDDRKWTSSLFDSMWRMGVLNVAVIVLDRTNSAVGEVKVYSYFPFSSNGLCFDTRPVLLGFWNSSDCTPTIIFPENKTSNLHGCKLRISTFDDWPFCNMTYPFGGHLGPLYNLVVKRMNFSASLHYPYEVEDNYTTGKCINGTCKNGVRGDVFLQRSDMGFAYLNPSNDPLHGVPTFVSTCITWCFPMDYKLRSMGILGNAFTYGVWLLLAGLVISGVAVQPRNAFNVVMSVVAGVNIQPKTVSDYVFYGFWFMFGLIITTAYLARMKSSLAAPVNRPLIGSESELADSDIRISTSNTLLKVLKEAGTSSEIYAKLADKIVSYNLAQFELTRIGKRGTTAILEGAPRCSSFKDIRTGESIFTLPGCFMSLHYSAIILPVGSPYRNPIEHLSLLLFDTGHMAHWLLPRKRRQRPPNPTMPLSFEDIYPALQLLLMGEIASCFIFLIELIYFKCPGITRKHRRFLRSRGTDCRQDPDAKTEYRHDKELEKEE